MIQLTPHMRILVATEPVDFRRGIDGLAAVCRRTLGQQPMDGAVFVFRNRRRTAIKLLVYDGQGFWLCHKRFSATTLRFWPTNEDACTDLQAHELAVLLCAGDPNATGAAPPWRPLSPS